MNKREVRMLFAKCPMCSNEVEPWAQSLRDIYNEHGLSDFCDSCGKGVDSCIDYWGHKKQDDINKLLAFINTGDEPRRRFTALMNGGYY